MINTIGQSNTPAVKLKESPCSPKREKVMGSIPSVFSRENILPPINSATIAFVVKMPERMIYKTTALSLRI
jgi:hypothetical protein